MTTVRAASEALVDDLKRDARPLEVREGDTTIQGKRVRLLVVTFVSKSQNDVNRLVKVLGPATGEESLIIPCGEGVELAQIEDILIAAKAKRKARAEQRLLYLPERQANMDRALIDLAEFEMARRKGSAFGPGGNFSRG